MIFVATNMCLSWQNTFFVTTKVGKTFVTIKLCLLRQKYFVMTNITLSWQNYSILLSWQKTCFVATNTCFVATNRCVSWQIFCCDKNDTCGSSRQWQNLVCSHYPRNKLKQAAGWTAVAQLWHSMVSSRQVLLIIYNANRILKLNSTERLKENSLFQVFILISSACWNKASCLWQNTFLRWPVPHSEHRFPAPSSKLCQIWLRHWRGTLYLCAAVHQRGQHPLKGSGTDKTVEAT